MEIREWIASITEDGLNEVARKSGVAQRTLYNQLDKGALTAENVIRIAVSYNSHPFRALIETGHIDRAWEQVPDVKAALRLAAEDDLAEEVVRRLVEAKALKRTTALDTPIDELAAKRSTATTPDVHTPSDNDDVLRGIDPTKYAAHPKTDPLDEDNPTP